MFYRHPYVLSFIEAADMDDSLALVVEACVPLETWLNNLPNNDTSDEPVQLQELIWGFKCILMALNFLHTNCSLLHGNLGLHSIFVTPNGDWKLGSLELASNLSLQQDLDHFLQYQHLLDSTYCSPERQQGSNEQTASSNYVTDILKAKLPPYYLDIYSVGQCMQTVFNKLNLEMPRTFNKYLSSMIHAEYKKRPTPLKLCQSAMFNSEHMQFIESIGELSMKAPKDFLDVISKMEPKVAGLSKSVCAHKILPNLSRTLQIAINDFPNRDARESCRQVLKKGINNDLRGYIICDEIFIIFCLYGSF